MQMNDKQRSSASVIILLIYKPLSSVLVFLRVHSGIRDFSIFRSKLGAFYALRLSGFSNYSIMEMCIYIFFLFGIFFFFEWVESKIYQGAEIQIAKRQSTRLKDARFCSCQFLIWNQGRRVMFDFLPSSSGESSHDLRYPSAYFGAGCFTIWRFIWRFKRFTFLPAH